MAINTKINRSPATGALWELTASDWNGLVDELNAEVAARAAADLAIATGSPVAANDLEVTATGTESVYRLADWMDRLTRFGEWNGVAQPATNPTLAEGASGALSGTYYYIVTYVSTLGETEAGPAAGPITVTAKQIELTSIPVSSDSRVTARRIYRTEGTADESVLAKLVATINDNTATTYTDNIADGSLGAPVPRDNVTGGFLMVRGNNVGSAGTSTTRLGLQAHEGVTGYSNTAVGFAALKRNTTGSRNCAFGVDALQSNTTGVRNTAVGVHALDHNVSGIDNVGVGFNALAVNLGNENTAVGTLAMGQSGTGSQNTAVGFWAMVFNDTGNANVGVGHGALYNCPNGVGNTAVGVEALKTMGAGGYYNTFIGFYAGHDIIAGEMGNTAVGAWALQGPNVGSGNVAIGANAGRYETGDNYLWIDNRDWTDLATSKANAMLYGSFAYYVQDRFLTCNAQFNANAGFGLPITNITGDYTMLATDSVINVTGTGAIYIAMLSGSNQIGKIVTFRNKASFPVNSSGVGIIPLGGGGAGISILPATPGKWADLQFNGTAWEIIRSN